MADRVLEQPCLIAVIPAFVKSRLLLNYLWQVIRRIVESGGNFRDITTGISSGCSISPILRVLYLKRLDERLGRGKYYYVRYMDDILVLSRTRWHNRQAVKMLNQVFAQLKLRKHPDKTFIGRIEAGFDFLGYHFGQAPLQLARQSVRKHIERLLRLYEQQTRKKATPSEVALVLGAYVKRWWCWCNAELHLMSAEVPTDAWMPRNPSAQRQVARLTLVREL